MTTAISSWRRDLSYRAMARELNALSPRELGALGIRPTILSTWRLRLRVSQWQVNRCRATGRPHESWSLFSRSQRLLPRHFDRGWATPRK